MPIYLNASLETWGKASLSYVIAQSEMDKALPKLELCYCLVTNLNFINY